MDHSEEELLAKVAGGDTTSFDSLVEQYQQRIFNVALRILHSRESAEDVTQETLIRAYTALQSGEEIKNFGAWAARVATNLALSQARDSKVHLQTSFATGTEEGSLEWEPKDESEDADPGEATARKAVADLIWSLSADLSPNYRAILALRTVEQKDYDEIAKILEITPGNARVQFNRAKDALRQAVIRNLDRRAKPTAECKPVLEDLPKFLENQLPAERMQSVAKHLSTCKACAYTEKTCRDSLFGLGLLPLFPLGESFKKILLGKIAEGAGSAGVAKDGMGHLSGQKHFLQQVRSLVAKAGAGKVAAVAAVVVIAAGAGVVLARHLNHSVTAQPNHHLSASSATSVAKGTPAIRQAQEVGAKINTSAVQGITNAPQENLKITPSIFNGGFAIKSDGTAWLLDTKSGVPGEIKGIKNVVSISPPYALESDGTLVNFSPGASGAYQATTLAKNVVSFSDGCAINTNGVLLSDVSVPALNNLKSVFCNLTDKYAIKNDGTVLAWGDNTFGELGDGTTTQSTGVVQISGLSNVIAVSNFGDASPCLALESDGSVWQWGKVNPNAYVLTTPNQVQNLTNVIAIDSDVGTGYALKNDGTVWAWGADYNGQFGDGGKLQYSDTPVQVPTLNGVVAIATGYNNSMFALKSDGTIWEWGSLQSGIFTNQIPVQVGGYILK